MKNYLVRDIPDAVDQAIDALFPEQPVRGHTSPRGAWQRTIICIGALGPARASSAYDLWQSALAIARRRRGKDDLRSAESIRGTFLQELPEFDGVLARYQRGELPQIKLLSRLSSILYYLMQEYVQHGDIRDLNAVSAYYCERADIAEAIAWRVAAAKFLIRAAHDAKDEEAEERAMLRVFDEFSQLLKTHTKIT